MTAGDGARILILDTRVTGGDGASRVNSKLTSQHLHDVCTGATADEVRPGAKYLVKEEI